MKVLKHKVFGEFEVTTDIDQGQLEAWSDYLYNAENDKHGFIYRNRILIEAAAEAKILLKTKPDWKKESPALISWLSSEIATIINEITTTPKN